MFPFRRIYIVGILVTMLIAIACYTVFFSGLWEERAPLVPLANPAPAPLLPAAEQYRTNDTSPQTGNNPVVPQEVATARISLDFFPPWAVIKIDGKPLPKGARSVTVMRDRQTHLFNIEAPGYQTESVAIVADGDKLVAIRLKLAKQVATPSASSEPRSDTLRKSQKPASKNQPLKLKSNPYQ